MEVLSRCYKIQPSWWKAGKRGREKSLTNVAYVIRNDWNATEG